MTGNPVSRHRPGPSGDQSSSAVTSLAKQTLLHSGNLRGLGAPVCLLPHRTKARRESLENSER